MTWPWERAFVINLAKRPERLDAFRKQAVHLDLDVKALRGKYDPACPASGCMVSHVTLLTFAAQMVGATAIFEDDALFIPGFRGKLGKFVDHLPSDWEVLWLGGKHRRVPRPIAEGVVAPTRAHRSQAYVVRDGDVAARLLANARSHLDDRRHFDHVTAEFMLNEQMHVFAPSPWLVGQAAGPSDITGGTARERWE